LLAVSDTLRENAKQLLRSDTTWKRRTSWLWGVDNDRTATTLLRSLA
jgi:hypothetical protein